MKGALNLSFDDCSIKASSDVITDTDNMGSSSNNNNKAKVASWLNSEKRQQPKAFVSIVVSQKTEKEKKQLISKDKHHIKPVSYSPSEFLSILYATVMILMGLAMPVTDALGGHFQKGYFMAGFEVYMFFVASVFLIYLQVSLYLNKHVHHEHDHAHQETHGDLSQPGPRSANDIFLVRHLSKPSTSSNNSLAGDIQNTDGQNKQMEPPLTPGREASSSIMPSVANVILDENGDVGDAEVDTGWEEESMVNSEDMEEVVEYLTLKTQTASQSHAGTSLYLRLGALVFTIGNLVLVGLQLEYYYSPSTAAFCKEDLLVWPLYFHLLFLVVQSFFILKHSVFYLKRWRSLARFGLMHVVATNMNVWLRYLVIEITESVHHTSAHHDDKSDQGNNETTTGGAADECSLEGSIYAMASPYLFPFVLEYSLISVATLLAMFFILNMPISTQTFEAIRQLLHHTTSSNNNQKNSDHTALQTHHQHDSLMTKSHTGVFLGLLVLTGTAVSIVLFFYYNDKIGDVDTAVLAYMVSDIILLSIMLLAVIWGAYRLYPLATCYQQVNLLDDVLLVIAMSGLLLFELFIMISCFMTLLNGQEGYHVVIDATSAILDCVQALMQTCFIVAGLQKRSVDPSHREHMPGRGALAFLIITNVCVWIDKTFQVKEIALLSHRDFYGDIAWPIIVNINLPMMLFYRFHSSVCIADIWISAYHDAERSPRKKSQVEGVLY